MNSTVAIAEVFLTAFKSLPEEDKKTIVERLLAELNKDFTEAEWKKIEILAKQPGKMYSTSKEAKRHVNKL